MLIPFHDDNPTGRTPVVTVALIAVSVLCFLWVRSLPPVKQHVVFYRYGFVPRWLTQLDDPQPIDVVVDQKTVWNPWFGRRVMEKKLRLTTEPRYVLFSLVSCMFLHGGWMHLIGNMWFLWLFGNNVEDRLGRLGFLIFYILGGLAASGCHWLAGPNGPDSDIPVIGASGAVAAVLGAYAITWPWARVHTLVFLFIFITIIDLPALFVLGIWFLGQLLEANRALNLGIAGGVAWWAHVGGFVAGTALMPAVSAVAGALRLPGSARRAIHSSSDDPL
jgi:membrane associated rhomboid family serine protease